jgi:hypothetical protein
MFYINDPDGHVMRIAQEMLNFETGRKIFDNGMWIDRKVHMNYPIINSPDKKSLVRIKSQYGNLYLPVTETNYKNFIRDIKIAINHEVDAHPEIQGLLHAYQSVETGTFGFTNLRAKNNLRGDVTSDEYMSVHKTPGYIRVFMFSAGGLYNDISPQMRFGKFIWRIIPTGDLHDHIFSGGTLSMEEQIGILLSITYDPKKVLVWSNGTIWNDDLELEHFTSFARFSDITCYGSIRSIDTDKIPAKLRDTAKAVQYNYEQESKLPGYVPGWHRYTGSIQYNNMHKSAYEIRRWLSPKFSELFASGMGIQWQGVKKWRPRDALYEVNFEDVDLVNSENCELCGVPLYDDFYCLFTNKSTNTCYGYCPMCIHAGWWTFTNQETGERLPSTTSIYTFTYYIQDEIGAEVIARTKHPRTVMEVIDMIPGNADGLDLREYVEVLKSLHAGETIIENQDEYGNFKKVCILMGKREAITRDTLYAFAEGPHRDLFNRELFASLFPGIDDDMRDAILRKIVFVYAEYNNVFACSTQPST